MKGVNIRTVGDHCLKQFRSVAIESIIGGGKTSTIKELARIAPDQFIAFTEPVEAWKNLTIDGTHVNLLKSFYESRSLSDVNFLQQYISLTMHAQTMEVEKLLEANPKIRVVTERTIQSSERFIEGLRDMGILPDPHASAQLSVSRCYSDSTKLRPLRIFLNVPASVALQRIKARGRPEEANITQEYLEIINSRIIQNIGENDLVVEYESDLSVNAVAELLYSKLF